MLKITHLCKSLILAKFLAIKFYNSESVEVPQSVFHFNWPKSRNAVHHSRQPIQYFLKWDHLILRYDGPSSDFGLARGLNFWIWTKLEDLLE